MRIKNLTFNMIPNSLRHPSESGEYLVVTTYRNYIDNRHEVGYMSTLKYSKKHDAWNVDDSDMELCTQISHDRILAWTPFKPIADNLRGMVNEYNMETLKAKLAKAQATLAEITEEAAHDQ